MAALKFEQTAPGQIQVEGELTFSNIDKNTVKSCSFLNGAENVSIDMQNVTASDSAGLALVVEWIKVCEQQQIAIVFHNIPAQLHALAKLTGFDQTPYFASDNA